MFHLLDLPIGAGQLQLHVSNDLLEITKLPLFSLAILGGGVLGALLPGTGLVGGGPFVRLDEGVVVDRDHEIYFVNVLDFQDGAILVQETFLML